jgi:hypothetical protein
MQSKTISLLNISDFGISGCFSQVFLKVLIMSGGILDTTISSPLSTAPMQANEELRSANIDNANTIANDSLEKGETRDAPVDAPRKSFKFKITIFMLCLSSVVVSMDSVIVAAALPAITVALKGGTLEAFWVGTFYLLSQTVS